MTEVAYFALCFSFLRQISSVDSLSFGSLTLKICTNFSVKLQENVATNFCLLICFFSTLKIEAPMNLMLEFLMHEQIELPLMNTDHRELCALICLIWHLNNLIDFRLDGPQINSHG